jgi:hypothetical protein
VKTVLSADLVFTILSGFLNLRGRPPDLLGCLQALCRLVTGFGDRRRSLAVNLKNLLHLARHQHEWQRVMNGCEKRGTSPVSTAARTCASRRCLAQSRSERILRVSCCSHEPEAIGGFPRRGVSRMAARPSAPESAPPAQLGAFQSPHSQVRATCRVRHPYPEERFLTSRP